MYVGQETLDLLVFGFLLFRKLGRNIIFDRYKKLDMGRCNETYRKIIMAKDDSDTDLSKLSLQPTLL
jgi:hypothetical protein